MRRIPSTVIIPGTIQKLLLPVSAARDTGWRVASAPAVNEKKPFFGLRAVAVVVPFVLGTSLNWFGKRDTAALYLPDHYYVKKRE